MSSVSCLCLTYGRPHMLEEAIESFLRQDWNGKKELIVVNDYIHQEIIYSHPEVKIINLRERIKTLGEKRAYSVQQAQYDNLLPWDDDDICLPWRISETMKTLEQNQYYKCPHAWTMNNNIIEKQPGYNLYHAASAYTRWLYDKAGGYKALNGGEDADLEKRFQKVGNHEAEYWPHTILPWERLYYIYKWIHGSFHTTGCSNLNNIRVTTTKGKFIIKPQWHNDYVKLALDAAKRLSNDSG